MQSVEPNLRWLSDFQQFSGSLISFLALSRFWIQDFALTGFVETSNSLSETGFLPILAVRQESDKTNSVQGSGQCDPWPRGP